MINFKPLIKPFFHTISEKFWGGLASDNKKTLFNLLVIFSILLLAGFFNLILVLAAFTDYNCILCEIGVVILIVLALFCILKGRINCALNTAFSMPFVVYAFYISDFNQHAPLHETVYFSMWWLLAGLIFLLYFTESNSKIVFYFILSLFTLSFQLLKANHLFDSFSYYEPFVTHPVIVFTIFFVFSYILRIKHNHLTNTLSGHIENARQSVTKVLQDSGFSVAQIRAERDEGGNVVNLWIEKVNHAFESTFKRNLYELQNQEAGYIFNLIFRDHFDVNKILLYEKRMTREFHAKNLDKWFKIHVLKPGFSSFYLIFEDITKAKKKTGELENSKKRYKVLLEAIPDIFFVIDKDGVYEDFVIKESDLFKVDDVNIIGSSIFDVGFPDNMANMILKYIRSCIKNNSIENIEYALNTPNGTFLFEMRLAKLNDRSVISVARDITERKTAEINLEKAKKKAEESDRLKSAFLSNLSHEIRTPLNIITNFTRMLTEPDLAEPEKLEISDAILQNGQQLLNMIDNTIHLSKIETKTVEVKMEFCQVNSLIRNLYSQYLPLLPDSKEIKLRMSLDVPNLSFGFITEPRLLNEALAILIDNAIKYTVRGEVVFGYEMIRNEAVKFIVYDTGIGIPKDETENIFSRFYRIKNHINDTTSGSGIGLPIAQHYIEHLGGKLELESKPETGTKIWFVLPFKEGQGFLKIVS